MSPDSFVPRTVARAIRLHGVALTAVVVVGCSDIPRRTALDEYVETPDPTYAWKVAGASGIGARKLRRERRIEYFDHTG